ncbi:hypothetical protein VMB_31590 [Vibrio mimicus VM603]|uniref:Uncharacterized protein n=1 Tax=Vibrio mimicus VM603 TaxID=671074 RepID=D2YI12_VIBMI|nr:hypothetical protein VMB_31590 [Vibrio mimicus VM603]
MAASWMSLKRLTLKKVFSSLLANLMVWISKLPLMRLLRNWKQKARARKPLTSVCVTGACLVNVTGVHQSLW